MTTGRGRRVGLLSVAAVLTMGGLGLAAPRAEKSIDSQGGVSLHDPDGHPHRTAPKRVGEHINLWCLSTRNRRRVVEVRTFLEAQEVAFRTIKCPRGDRNFARRHQIFRPKEPGIYAMVLQGGGFDSFVIRTRVRPRVE